MKQRSAFSEALEPRRLYSVTLDAGVVKITATDGDDAVVVKRDAVKRLIMVYVNGAATSFPQGAVTKISAMLGAGKDVFNASTIALPVMVDGEGGNDTILGGIGDDCLIGGLDNDSCLGGEGADSVSGNGGKDYLDGGPGRDRLDGGKSNDIVHGGSSNDRLIGGEGCDQMYGDGGDDLFYSGGVYSDSLFGGTGTDRAYVDGDDVLASIEIKIMT